MGKRKEKLDRAKVVALITRDVKRLVRVGDERSEDIIADVLDALAWLSNSHDHTTEDYAHAIIALAPIASTERLEHAAHLIVWLREIGKGVSDEAAEVEARHVLAPMGVRYARCGCLAFVAADSDTCCDAAVASRKAAEEAKRQAEVEASEARALGLAREALDKLADCPATMQRFIAMVPLLGSRTLKELQAEPKARAS
jgi:hypothetical protein